MNEKPVIPPEARDAVVREVGAIMSKLRDQCVPKTVREWEELCASYDKELEKLEKENAELQALGRCTLDGRPDFAGFAAALRAEAHWESEIKSGDKTGQLATDLRQLEELAKRVEQVGKMQGYLP